MVQNKKYTETVTIKEEEKSLLEIALETPSSKPLVMYTPVRIVCNSSFISGDVAMHDYEVECIIGGYKPVVIADYKEV